VGGGSLAYFITWHARTAQGAVRRSETPRRCAQAHDLLTCFRSSRCWIGMVTSADP
jgi:hypothetical protein